MKYKECDMLPQGGITGTCEICGAIGAGRLSDIGYFCPRCAQKTYTEYIKRLLEEHSYTELEINGATLGADLTFNAGRNYQYECTVGRLL